MPNDEEDDLLGLEPFPLGGEEDTAPMLGLESFSLCGEEDTLPIEPGVARRAMRRMMRPTRDVAYGFVARELSSALADRAWVMPIRQPFRARALLAWSAAVGHEEASITSIVVCGEEQLIGPGVPASVFGLYDLGGLGRVVRGQLVASLGAVGARPLQAHEFLERYIAAPAAGAFVELVQAELTDSELPQSFEWIAFPGSEPGSVISVHFVGRMLGLAVVGAEPL